MYYILLIGELQPFEDILRNGLDFALLKLLRV